MSCCRQTHQGWIIIGVASWLRPRGQGHGFTRSRSWLHEVKVMASFNHENILHLIGVVPVGTHVTCRLYSCRFNGESDLCENIMLVGWGGGWSPYLFTSLWSTSLSVQNRGRIGGVCIVNSFYLRRLCWSAWIERLSPSVCLSVCLIVRSITRNQKWKIPKCSNLV